MSEYPQEHEGLTHRGMRASLSPQEFWELTLSHHPDLPCFKDDVITLLNHRICAGCLFGYPTAIMVLFLFRPSGYESIIAAIIIASISQLRRLFQNVWIRHVGRFFAGIALGCGLGGAYWGLSNSQWPAVILIFLGGLVYLAFKIYSVKKVFQEEYCKEGN